MEDLMKNLTIITASLSVFLASCGDKTQFSSASNKAQSQPSTPVAVEGRSETTSETTPKRVTSQAREKSSSDDALASAESSPSPQDSVGSTVDHPAPASASTKPVDQNTSAPKVPVTPETNAPQNPSPDSKSPAPTPFTAQVESEIAKAVATKQQSSGAALTSAQVVELSAGLTSLVGSMAAGPVQGPAALGTLVDLIKSVKGLKANAAALPAIPAIPALPALADAAVLADLAAALGDLAAAAADLDVAGIVAAIQDLIALIMDLIA
jgi:hypothetical protein